MVSLFYDFLLFPIVLECKLIILHPLDLFVAPLGAKADSGTAFGRTLRSKTDPSGEFWVSMLASF